MFTIKSAFLHTTCLHFRHRNHIVYGAAKFKVTQAFTNLAVFSYFRINSQCGIPCRMIRSFYTKLLTTITDKHKPFDAFLVNKCFGI